jgi:hypothetical protein
MKGTEKTFQMLDPIVKADDSLSPEPFDESEVNVAPPFIEKIDPGDIKPLPISQKEVIESRAERVAKAKLINIINLLNFQDKTLLVNLHHTKYDRSIFLKAAPLPCEGDRLDCRWAHHSDVRSLIESCVFKRLLIARGRKLIQVIPEVIEMNKNGISLLLPETSIEIGSRRIRRHPCTGIDVQLIQSSTVFTGVLKDFNAFSFKVELELVPPQTYEWINPDVPVNIILSDGRNTLYSGECNILRHSSGWERRVYVLQPLKQEIQRYRKTEFRSQRQQLTPSPDLILRHPFTGKRVNLKVLDLSGSGFSVEENENRAVLMPGMILPAMELSFANSFKITCSAQVIFRKPFGEQGGSRSFKCGLSLLDLDAKDHMKLIALLHQARDKNAYLCNEVDLDALWDFFFETGFIYPQKYAVIQKNREKIKATYAKLYTQSPQVARHFIYQDKGQILGHMAMVRFYQNTWLIHHHAARKSSANKAGLIVLDQIGRFTYDSYRLYSLHLIYLMCFYRPDNKFPNRVFGGVAKHLNDPKGCSLDPFAYLHFDQIPRETGPLPPPWRLEKTGAEDLFELHQHYENVSGGLMIRALDLEPTLAERRELENDYQDIGLRREKWHYSLKSNQRLKALFLVDISDIGLNLSDLTNCVKVMVVDPEEMDGGIIYAAICEIARQISISAMPILIHPLEFADQCALPYQKVYNLWILRVPGQSDKYFKYLNRLLRFV